MLKVAIVTGSTRPGRKSLAIAEWVQAIAAKRGDAQYDVVDIATFDLPLFDEPMPPTMGNYTKAHTKKWAAAIDGYDAFVFVTPEYNHAPSAALKNAIDYLYKEWNNKAVGYGGAGGARAIEHLRLVMGELSVADVRGQVGLSLFTDFENFSTFKPTPPQEGAVGRMLDQVVAWGGALKPLRAKG